MQSVYVRCQRLDTPSIQIIIEVQFHKGGSIRIRLRLSRFEGSSRREPDEGRQLPLSDRRAQRRSLDRGTQFKLPENIGTGKAIVLRQSRAIQNALGVVGVPGLSCGRGGCCRRPCFKSHFISRVACQFNSPHACPGDAQCRCRQRAPPARFGWAQGRAASSPFRVKHLR